MPTGYTAGIIDGKITTFEQFAKQCMRAFGATIHMRDDAMDKEYEPQKPSSYHKDQIQITKNQITKIKSLSDDEIIQLRTGELRSEIKQHNEALKKERKVEKQLKRILDDVQEWTAPTYNHIEFKRFMLDQLRKTLEYDGISEWRKEQVKDAEKQITSIYPAMERDRIIEQLDKDLKYYKKELQKEIKRCEDGNEWVNQLLESF